MNFFQIFGFGKQKPMKGNDFTSDEAKAAAAWLRTVNPLKGMTATRMQNLYDASRNGDTVHLQWLYQEIEKVDPTLLICQQRRTGALAALDWNVKTRNQKRTRGFDETLAQEQADCLELAFGDADQANFNDAIEHLARGFFRGFSHVLPHWSEDGLSIKGFDCLDQWNFVRDPLTGQWYWNPEAHAYTGYANCRPIPPGELVTFVAPYHIDYPAMTIYLRSAVGEQGWAKFVERFGIPPVILTMPSDIPSDQVESWRQSAEKVAEGGSGAVPSGTAVNFCDGARGINPFKDFIHNQRELVVLMSTGGLLTSLTESGSGTLAGGAHSETWAEVRRMDSAKIGSVLNRTLADAILDRAFPGRPHLAYFSFDTEAVPSPGEVFDDAAKAKASGYLIDQADLEERTGYRLVKDEAAAPALPGMFGNRKLANKEPSGFGMPAGAPYLNKKLESEVEVGERKDQFRSPTPTQDSHSVLAAFAKDSGPAAEAVAAFLQDPSKERAESLLKDLPTLLPEDPALAAVIAEEMAKEFSNTETITNADRVPAGNGNGGQFTGKTNQPDGKSPRNDGKVDFNGNAKAKSQADRQSKALGYIGIDDLMKKSTSVPREKVNSILEGGNFTCEPHEAVAALRTLSVIKSNVKDGEVKLSERALRHYVCGERRHHRGEPDIGRLRSLPQAIDAVKHSDSRHWELDEKPVVLMDGETPIKGTQAVYCKNRGKTKTYAYADSGVLNGWQVN